MIKKISKNKILQRLEQLEKVVPTNEPLVVFIKQLNDNCFQVSFQISKGNGKVEIQTYTVHSVEDFYKANPELKCPIFYDDMEYTVEDETIMFHALIKIADESEIDTLVTLMAKSMRMEGTSKELDDYIQPLIKKYRAKILETVGFDTAYYDGLTVAQLKRLIGEENEDY